MSESGVLALRPVAQGGAGLVKILHGTAQFRLSGISAGEARVLLSDGKTLSAPVRHAAARIVLPRGARVAAAAVTRDGVVLLLGAASVGNREASDWANRAAKSRRFDRAKTQAAKEPAAQAVTVAAEPVDSGMEEAAQNLSAQPQKEEAPAVWQTLPDQDVPTGAVEEKSSVASAAEEQGAVVEASAVSEGVEPSPVREAVASIVERMTATGDGNTSQASALAGEETEGECPCMARGLGYVEFLRRMQQGMDGTDQKQSAQTGYPQKGGTQNRQQMGREPFSGWELPPRGGRRLGVLTDAFARDFPRQAWQVYARPNGSHLLHCRIGRDRWYALPSEASATPPPYLPRDARYCVSRTGRGYWVFRS